MADEYTGIDVPSTVQVSEGSTGSWGWLGTEGAKYISIPIGNSGGYIRADTNRDQMSTIINREQFLYNGLFVNRAFYTKEEVDSLLSQTVYNLDWKESVDTYDDIEPTYGPYTTTNADGSVTKLTPQDGWVVNVKDTNITYRYTEDSDGSNGKWISISTTGLTPLVTSTTDGFISSGDFNLLHDINDTELPSLRTQMSNIEAKALPLGTVIPYAIVTSVAPAGYAFAEGELLNRADYPDLCTLIFGSDKIKAEDESGDYDGSVTAFISDSYRDLYPGRFTTGDGSVDSEGYLLTFRLPNYQGLFLRGYNAGTGNFDEGRSIGSYQADALAPHTHTISGSTVNAYDSSSEDLSIAVSNTVDTVSVTTNSNSSSSDTRPVNVAIRYLIKVKPSEQIDNTYTSAATTDLTDINASKLNNFSTALTSSSNAIPVANSSGKLDSSWIDLDALTDSAYVLQNETSTVPIANKIPIAVNSTLDNWISSGTVSDVDDMWTEIFGS